MKLQTVSGLYKFLILPIIIITFFSSLFMLSSISSDNLEFARKDATGFKVRQATQFFYFYKNMSLFPLATDERFLRRLPDTRASAVRFVKNNPEKLRMEIKHWYRFGESARVLALFPSYYSGDPINKLSLKPLNTIIFSITALVLFAACYRFGGGGVALAALSVYLSSQFIIAESFLKDNIFAIQPMLHILAISLFAIVHREKKRYLLAVTFIVTLLSGFFSEIRGENVTVLLVPMLYWMFCFRGTIAKKLLVMFLICISCLAVKTAIRSHFEAAFERTYRLVDDVGGITFDGAITEQHPIWHPLLAGLGDYGQDKGFIWSDWEIFVRVLGKAGYSPEEIMKVRNTYYDPETKYYYKRAETLGNYSDLAREEFLTTIMDDPIWYAEILVKRAGRVLFDVPPVTVYFFKQKIEIGFYYLTVMLLVIGLAINGCNYFKRFNRLDLFALLASLSMSSIPFLIHTGKGATYGTIVPLVVSIILFSKCLPKRREKECIAEGLVT